MINHKTIREVVMLKKLLPCEPGELHYEEIQTNPQSYSVTFTTNVVGDIKDLYVDIVPKQSGSGDPSPDNIRPITGTDNLKFSHSLIPATGTINVIDIPLGETIYGGYYNSVTGELWKTQEGMVLNGSENWGAYSNRSGFYLNITDMATSTAYNGYCDKLKVSAAWTEQLGIRFGQANSYIYVLQITNNISDVTDVPSWKSYLEDNNITIVYPLATPVKVADITPVEIKSLIGKQKIQSTNKFSFSLKYPYMTGGACNKTEAYLPLLLE